MNSFWRPLAGGVRRSLAAALLLLPSLCFAYLLGAIAAALLPANRDWAPAGGGAGAVEIFILSNGFHTDLLLPVAGATRDWRVDYPLPSFGSVHPDAPFIGFGWGDQAFYLQTPRLSDVRPATALAALIGAGPAVLRVGYFWRPQPGPHVRRLSIDRATLERLEAAIARWQIRDTTGRPVRIADGYAPHDAFFAAAGRYNAVLTCNEWAAARLREAGIRAPRWSPFARGLLFALD